VSYLIHRIDVRSVHQALAGAGEAARAAVMARFRAAGGSLDRWASSDLEAMAAAVSQTEDELERSATGRLTPARAGLRSIRRQLEKAT
jgi:hypothetical protein